MKGISSIRLIAIVFWLFIPELIFCQNLVNNGSFEDTISCPTSAGQIDKAVNWFSTVGGGGSSELFHTCASFGYPSVPLNYFGYQFPRTGEAFAGICVFTEYYHEYREYIETSMITGLNPKITYYVEFHVSLASISKYAVQNIGAHFTTMPLTQSYLTSFGFKPHIEYSGPPINDTSGWVKVSGYYRPSVDGINYLTIGNFRQNDSTTYQTTGFAIGNTYYYIDDVLVMDSALVGVGIEKQPINKTIQVFPNPAKEAIHIDLSSVTETRMLRVYNITGQLVAVRTIQNAGTEFTLDLQGFDQGLYFFELIGDSGRLGSGKFVNVAGGN